MTSFDPTTTFLHLDGGRAEVLPVDDQFWPSVISGARPLPGWLVTASSWAAPGAGEPDAAGAEPAGAGAAGAGAAGAVAGAGAAGAGSGAAGAVAGAESGAAGAGAAAAGAMAGAESGATAAAEQSGRPKIADSELLVARIPQEGAAGHSEVHPRGDEIHLCISGAMTAVIEHDGGGESRVDFGAGQVCVIPAGLWHRLEASQDSQLLSITFGEGSEHRPAPGP